MADTKTQGQRRRGRSPGYPGIDLEKALERARTFYEQEGRNSAAVKVLLGHWGFVEKSGVGSVTLAALRKFGLIEIQGTGAGRKARLTDLALRIILDKREGSRERAEAIKTAALTPSIHAEIWAQFEGKSLPSEDNLRFYLENERKFTESGATEFIQQFSETLTFAGLDSGGMLSTGEQEKPSGGGMTPPAQIDTPPGNRAIQVPLTGNQWATLQAPFPLSETAWRQMLAVLEAMKPGLVAGEKPEGSD